MGAPAKCDFLKNGTEIVGLLDHDPYLSFMSLSMNTVDRGVMTTFSQFLAWAILWAPSPPSAGPDHVTASSHHCLQL